MNAVTIKTRCRRGPLERSVRSSGSAHPDDTLACAPSAVPERSAQPSWTAASPDSRYSVSAPSDTLAQLRFGHAEQSMLPLSLDVAKPHVIQSSSIRPAGDRQHIVSRARDPNLQYQPLVHRGAAFA